jgi:hypothetical protein
MSSAPEPHSCSLVGHTYAAPAEKKKGKSISRCCAAFSLTEYHSVNPRNLREDVCVVHGKECGVGFRKADI